jgi:hypothetical protein
MGLGPLAPLMFRLLAKEVRSMNEKAKVAEKVRALLAKTVDNGCTEAEAMAAAIKAQALMEEYQINLSEHDLEQEGCISGTAAKAKPSRFNIQQALGNAIAEFTDCKVWNTFESAGYRRSDKRLVYFGLRSDVELANWLTVALEAFVWTQANLYEESLKRQFGPCIDKLYYERRNFMMGACSRISARLRAAQKAKAPVNASDGRALMVVKNQIVTREFNKLGMRFSSGSGSSFNQGGTRDSFAAGQAAGDKASFNRPVGGGSSPRMIGKS